MLQGKKIRLTAVHENDLSIVSRWFANPEFMRLFDAVPAAPKSERHFKKWLEEEPNDTFRFAIRIQESDEIIGFVEIDDILWNHRTAWLGIGIGDSEHRNKGFGKEAMELALEFCFHELNLHRVQLTVFEYNKGAIKLYENLGFQKEGSYREFINRDGKRYNMELYGILKTEWQQKR